MFENVGRKIKILAEFIFWFGVFVSFIGALIIFTLKDGLVISETTVMNVVSPIYAVITLVFGVIVSLILSFFIYGFGQIVENTDKIVENTDKIIETCVENKREYTENDSFADLLKETSTKDLELFLSGQRNECSKEELRLIEKELKSRSDEK